MNELQNIEEGYVTVSIKYQYVRMVLAATAGFFVSKLVEKAFDAWLRSQQEEELLVEAQPVEES